MTYKRSIEVRDYKTHYQRNDIDASPPLHPPQQTDCIHHNNDRGCGEIYFPHSSQQTSLTIHYHPQGLAASGFWWSEGRGPAISLTKLTK